MRDGPLLQRLRARDLVPPDNSGGSLVNVAATVLGAFGVRNAEDPPPLRGLDPSLKRGIRQIVVVLADGLGTAHLGRSCARGDMPFLASHIERAADGDAAQLLAGTTVFPSTTAAAITTMHTARWEGAGDGRRRG